MFLLSVTYENHYFFRLKNSLHICKLMIFRLISVSCRLFLFCWKNKSIPFLPYLQPFIS